MSKGHYSWASGSVEYGNASVLFPLEELDATVYRHRDAERALAAAASDDVAVVAPTGLATSYALAEHGLAAIRVDSLPSAVRARLDDALPTPVETFDLIQVGRWADDSPNRSLAEFTDA